MKVINFFKNKKGFTLIEMMVAIAVFTVVMTMGMTALLNSYKNYRKTQDMRSILDSINFTMEDMSKNIRVGASYVCDNNSTTYNCPSGHILTFTRTDGSNSGVGTPYVYSINITDGVKREVGSEGAVFLLDPQVSLNSSSGFTVTGASSGDKIQPLVTIHLSGMITSSSGTTPFSLQTSVSQRLIDITQ